MSLFLLTAFLLLCFMSFVFLLALKLQDNSIVDIAYGLGFLLVGWSGFIAYGNGGARQLLMLALVSFWGLRLAGHIAARKLLGCGLRERDQAALGG
jgi:steroid 5-alpha reductase family enzyme